MSRDYLVVKPQAGVTHRWNVQDGIFFTTSPLIDGQCIGFLIEGAHCNDATFEQALQEVHECGLATRAALEFKIVGQVGHARKVRDYLSRSLFHVSACIERSQAFDMEFVPSECRLRVSKEIVQVPVSKIPRKVLIVDDSKTIRQLLTKVLSRDPELQVVAAAERPSEVEALIEKWRPDVITLDIHMPEMDGVTLLKKYLPKFPIPTVMISSISLEEGGFVLSALEHGAVDYIQKPSFEELEVVAPLIVEKVKAATQIVVKERFRSGAHRVSASQERAGLDQTTILALGSSTGGTEALRVLLTALPEDIPPTVAVQHIPPVFSKALATRLNDLCKFSVKEAADGDWLEPGKVLIAPGATQMRVKKVGERFKVIVDPNAEPCNRHKPSVDVLFDSVAEEVGPRSIAVIMTGMGGDGAKGMKKMRDTGSRTIAQDEESCVVFGMPQVAIKLGGVEKISPLTEIATTLVKWLKKK